MSRVRRSSVLFVNKQKVKVENVQAKNVKENSMSNVHVVHDFVLMKKPPVIISSISFVLITHLYISEIPLSKSTRKLAKMFTNFLRSFEDTLSKMNVNLNTILNCKRSLVWTSKKCLKRKCSFFLSLARRDCIEKLKNS